MIRILGSDADALRGVETASVEAELDQKNAYDGSLQTVPKTFTLRLESGEWRICTGPF